MIKRFVFILGILFAGTLAFAQTEDEYVKTHTEDLLTKIKAHRASMYSKLELTSEQRAQINELDKNCYEKLEPELVKLSVMTKKIEDLANSDKCTKKAVYAVKKDFKSVEKDMNSIKKEYDKEFRQLLNGEQKAQYRIVRKQKRAELRQEMLKEIERQREQAKK